MSSINSINRQETLPGFDWPESKTYVYKTVGSIHIEVDVQYIPEEAVPESRNSDNSRHVPRMRPILLWIHGGGWTGGIRNDYPRPLIYEFLQKGFVVTSIDYRLLPESDFRTAQLQDIADAEPWLRETLPTIITQQDSSLLVDTKRIVVAGASAGSLLAAFTPKLWKIPPKALLLIYGPTNMGDLKFLAGRPLGGDRLRGVKLSLPENASPELIAGAFKQVPPTNIAPPKSVEEFLAPRSLLGLIVFKLEIIPEFLLKGVIEEENGVKKLPQKGSVVEKEVQDISPIFFPDRLFTDLIWPPTYQYIGSADEAFAESHIIMFDQKLKEHGIPSKAVVVEGKSHAFDMESQIGDEIHKTIICPAVKWVVGFVTEQNDAKKMVVRTT